MARLKEFAFGCKKKTTQKLNAKEINIHSETKEEKNENKIKKARKARTQGSRLVLVRIGHVKQDIGGSVLRKCTYLKKKKEKNFGVVAVVVS